MTLEEINELIDSKNIIIKNPEDKKDYSEKLNGINKYNIVESSFGAAFSDKGICSLFETLAIVKENPDKFYILTPIK